MRKFVTVLLAFGGMAFVLSWAAAQPPGEAGKDKAGRDSSIVTKMMAFNTTKDGKLTKEQLTDRRLHRLFDLADTNKDGVVTREELTALSAKLEAEYPAGGGFGDKGPKGKGKGFGGPGGFGPPQPGQIMPPFLQNMLKLTPEQKRQIDALQKDVDAKLGTILTDEQKQQLKDLPRRGPFGPGGPGGFGRPGGKGPPPVD